VRRVLRRDGTLWLNIGDSYCSIGHKKSGSGYGTTGLAGGIAQTHHPLHREANGPGLKHKDLIGIPWMLAFALRADGWWLRQDIIWAKPNPMPESVTDRCTKAHEQIFLFAKNGARPLLWNHRDTKAWVEIQPPPDYVWRNRKTGIETREPQVGEEWSRINLWSGFDYYYDAEAIAEQSAYPGDERHLRTDRTIEFARPDGGSRARTANPTGETRNKRSVWTIATAPYSEAHFAVFPPALVEPCILAGCPRGGTVLDPFGGAGTTGLVADRLGRNAVLIELNPDYAAMARRRIADDAGMFGQVAAD
jgi:DNA modification methylase